MRNAILQTIRILLILLFSYTTFHKLIDLDLFRTTLMKSTLIEEYQITFLFYFIPIIEIITVLSLISEKYLYGLYLSLLLMFAFTIYLIVLNNFSFYKGCSCGGVFNDMTYPQHIAINIFFVLISLISIFIYDAKINGKLRNDVKNG
jgi:hypothetical protein